MSHSCTSPVYPVTCGCEACHTQWETWGIAWDEPPIPGGASPPEGLSWLLGKPGCPHCQEERYTAVVAIHREPDDPRESGTPAGEEKR